MFAVFLQRSRQHKGARDGLEYGRCANAYAHASTVHTLAYPQRSWQHAKCLISAGNLTRVQQVLADNLQLSHSRACACIRVRTFTCMPTTEDVCVCVCVCADAQARLHLGRIGEIMGGPEHLDA